jgi:thiol-disulfide isomerase/thioredoxin
MRVILILGVLLALAACHKPAPQQAANEAAPAAEAGPHKGIDRSHKGAAIPDVKILDAMSIDMGSTTSLRYLSQGQPTLVNLWASWCAPCVKELPTLQKLGNQRGNALHVIPISQDSGPQRSVEAFLNKLGLDFVAYQDPKMALSAALGPDTVLPTTILYDAHGKEVWRFVGDLDWTSPEAAKLLAEAAAAPAKG